MQRITCQRCGWWCDATVDARPNDPNILACNCCTQWHDHDEAAAQTGIACRPVTVTLLDRLVITPGQALW